MRWLEAGTLAAAALAGVAGGWLIGYAHRGLVEWGRTLGKLAAWNRAHRGSLRGWRG